LSFRRRRNHISCSHLLLVLQLVIARNEAISLGCSHLLLTFVAHIYCSHLLLTFIALIYCSHLLLSFVAHIYCSHLLLTFVALVVRFLLRRNAKKCLNQMTLRSNNTVKPTIFHHKPKKQKSKNRNLKTDI